jgi:hypothetical protein
MSKPQSDIPLSEALQRLRALFEPFAEHGAEILPEDVRDIVELLGSAADEAIVLETLAQRPLDRLAGEAKRFVRENIIAFPTSARVHFSGGHVADRCPPDGGDAA